jgi:hypothetical protein
MTTYSYKVIFDPFFDQKSDVFMLFQHFSPKKSVSPRIAMGSFLHVGIPILAILGPFLPKMVQKPSKMVQKRPKNGGHKN